jgi:pimeloyl-ACP methyl ester carboxylesterase
MSFIDIQWRKRTIRVEYEWVGSLSIQAPILVFLHEGLGSVSMWKDFSQQLSESLGMRGLVYSRPAYGKSTARDKDEFWDVDFLHRQALEVFPAFLEALKIEEPVHLLGHSDGGSIALLIANAFPEKVRSTIVIAPHIFVESKTIQGIEQALVAYQTGSLRQVLARYHDDVDSVFYGWNDVWLKPEFKEWSITHELHQIACPLLAIQGSDDPYGTMAQVEDIGKYVKQVKVVKIPNGGHSLHRDSNMMLTKTIKLFLTSYI